MRQHPIVAQLSRRRLRPHANLDQAAFVSKRLPVADAGTIDWNDLDSHMGHRIATIISCHCFGRRFYPLDQLRLRDLHFPRFDGHIDFRAADEESGGHVACRSGDTARTSSRAHRKPDFASSHARAGGIIDPIDLQTKKLPRTVSRSSRQPQFFDFWWREHALEKSVQADFSWAENQNNK